MKTALVKKGALELVRYARRHWLQSVHGECGYRYDVSENKTVQVYRRCKKPHHHVGFHDHDFVRVAPLPKLSKNYR